LGLAHFYRGPAFQYVFATNGSPGISGWAQVNGAKLVTTEEKQKLDEWYVRNASLWLDLKIA